MHNILSNTLISDNYERRIQVEKLTPIGRKIIENYRHVRVDSRTVKLVKIENIEICKSKRISKNGKQLNLKK